MLKIRCFLAHEVSRVEPYMYESSKVGYIMILVIYNSIKSKHKAFIGFVLNNNDIVGTLCNKASIVWCLCRSFLPSWKNKNKEYQFEGRFNLGVQTLNLPQIAILSNKDMNKFWDILHERLQLL